MLNLKTLIKSALLLCLLSAPFSLSAETLSIINQPENSENGVLRPTRGMTMQQVEAKFGAPASINPTVGEPPITGWVYDQYTVYFEHQYVIHAAVNH